MHRRAGIDRVFGRWYERAGARYPRLALGAALRLEHVVLLISNAFLFLYVQLSLGEFAILALAAAAAQEVHIVGKLNELYELVVPVILRHGGHANKFIGDGLLALFGAPERHDDHADRAVAAALEIAACVEDRFRSDLSVGLGVNCGPSSLGPSEVVVASTSQRSETQSTRHHASSRPRARPAMTCS